MSALWLCRAKLRRDTAAVGSLARLLVPDDTGPRVAAGHRLAWALFTDGPKRTRDFLWREETPGQFIALAARRPVPMADLFEIECKPFEPTLVPGDVLAFTLRANPVVSHSTKPGQRGKRHDVVMDALRRLPDGQHAEARFDTATNAGRAWLSRQAATHGFRSDVVAVDSYQPVRIPRDDGGMIQFSQLEFTGKLTVTDPDLFLAAVKAGFGRAKAFGCGLMLIRRA